MGIVKKKAESVLGHEITPDRVNEATHGAGHSYSARRNSSFSIKSGFEMISPLEVLAQSGRLGRARANSDANAPVNDMYRQMNRSSLLEDIEANEKKKAKPNHKNQNGIC